MKKQSKIFISGDEHFNYNKKAQFLMLFGIVILLTLTNLYRFCTNIHALSIHHYLECCMVHMGNEIALTISSVLTTINCSMNCFVYIAASKDFRQYVLDYFKRPSDFFHKCKKNDEKSNQKKCEKELESNTPEINLQMTSTRKINGFGESRFCSHIETFTSASTKINVIPIINVFLIDGENKN